MRTISSQSSTSAAMSLRGSYYVHLGTAAKPWSAYVNVAYIHHIIPLIRLCYNLDYVELSGWVRVRQ